MKKNKTILALLLSFIWIAANAQIAVVSVNIETDKGATIGLDDEMSSTNIFTKDVVSGQHTLVIMYNNEVVKRETIDIPAGAAFNETYSIGGTVNINSTPTGIVSVDGKDFGSTPTTIDLLGQHTIHVRYENKKYKPVSETLNILPLENIERTYDLEKDKRPWKYSWMLLPQVTFPTDDTKDMKFGVMIARAKIIGWYIKGTFGFVSMDETHGISDIWPTGEHRVKYINACGGLMFNLFKPLYIYGGGGIGIRHIGYEDYGGKYYYFYDSNEKDNNDTDSSFAADFGLLVNLGHLALNGGCTLLNSKMAVNVGIGVKF